MKGLVIIFMIWFGLNGFATDLCGPADAKICLRSSARFTITATALYPGTRLTLSVPGVAVLESNQVEGQPSQAYRLEAEGAITDHQGGVWSAAQILGQDQRGATAISFSLEEGVLQNPIIDVQNITVCQFVSDGPTEVALNVQFAANFGLQTKTLLRQKMEGNAFRTCTENSGDLPMGEAAWLLSVHNPHQEAVVLSYGSTTYQLKANERMVLDGDAFIETSISSSLPLSMVVFSHENDINLTSLSSQNSGRWLLPHLGLSGAWENQWIFNTAERTELNWRQGDRLFSTSHEPGFQKEQLTVSPDDTASWAKIQADDPINGFFQFSQTNGQGEAWVNGDRSGEGSPVLYLPHVAADTLNFWTGISLANPNNLPAQVAFISHLHDGTETTTHLTIEAQSNYLGLLGVQGPFSVENAAWIKVESDQPISGLALIGSQGESWFSGYQLPKFSGDKLSFPYVNTSGNFWTGFAVVNVSDQSQTGVLSFFNDLGHALDKITIPMDAGQKYLHVAPPETAYATFTGPGFIGYCLVGDANGRIGGYLGISY